MNKYCDCPDSPLAQNNKSKIVLFSILNVYNYTAFAKAELP
ncbi:hypothetical protein [Nonlabens sp.]